MILNSKLIWAFLILIESLGCTNNSKSTRQVGYIELVTGPFVCIKLDSGELLSYHEGLHDSRNHAGVWVYIQVEDSQVCCIEKWYVNRPLPDPDQQINVKSPENHKESD